MAATMVLRPVVVGTKRRVKGGVKSESQQQGEAKQTKQVEANEVTNGDVEIKEERDVRKADASSKSSKERRDLEKKGGEQGEGKRQEEKKREEKEKKKEKEKEEREEKPRKRLKESKKIKQEEEEYV